MNRFLRDNGFGVALVIGVVLLALGLATGNLAALVIAIILIVIGVAARPLEEFALSRSGFLLKWQRDVVERVQRRLEDGITISDSVEAKVIRGEIHTAQRPQTATGRGSANAATVVTPGTAHLQLRTFAPLVEISRTQSPDEFAELIVDKIVKPIAAATEDVVDVEPDA